MLLGEHAVLRGRPAVVAAVEPRLTVEARPRPDRRVGVESPFGSVSLSREELRPPWTGPLRFAMAATAAASEVFDGGCALSIRSDIPSDVGLGSSAAVTVATIGALHALAGRAPAPHDVHAAALAAIRAVQGTGSGADAAASIWGGAVQYRADPVEVRPLGAVPPLTLVYCGYKRSTPEVVARVGLLCRAAPAFCEAVFSAMGAAAMEGAAALLGGDLAGLGRWMNAGHALMAALELETPELRAIADWLRAQPGVHGAKISGSGLGDCVVAIGRCACAPPAGRLIAAEGTASGLVVEGGP